jgi:hypothetical protein
MPLNIPGLRTGMCFHRKLKNYQKFNYFLNRFFFAMDVTEHSARAYKAERSEKNNWYDRQSTDYEFA